MSRIVVLSGSPRKGGNTELLVDSFVEGAKVHNDVEVISIREYKVNPCTGCNACRIGSVQRCVQKDDMGKVFGKLSDADILVIASPVYFYGVSAQLKAMIDRFHSPERNLVGIKGLALLLVGADTIPKLFDPIVSQYRLTLEYFQLKDYGMVLVGGVEEKAAIKGNEKLGEAYTLGLTLD